MKRSLLIVSIIGLSIAFTSCTKNSVSPSVSTASNSKNSSTTGNGSTTTSPVSTVPTITDKNLPGSWAVVSDSSYWAGELPKKLVSAYKGKSGDHFNFAKNGKLYSYEDGLSDTTAYSINDTTYRITVIYPDAAHFDEAPGFGLGIGFADSNPPVPVYFFQKYTDVNTLILCNSVATPDGVASRFINLKRVIKL